MAGFPTVQNSSNPQAKAGSLENSASGSGSAWSFRAVKTCVAKKWMRVDNWVRQPGQSLNTRRVIALALLCTGAVVLGGAAITGFASLSVLSAGTLPAVAGVAAAGGALAFAGYSLGRHS